MREIVGQLILIAAAPGCAHPPVADVVAHVGGSHIGAITQQQDGNEQTGRMSVPFVVTVGMQLSFGLATGSVAAPRRIAAPISAPLLSLPPAAIA